MRHNSGKEEQQLHLQVTPSHSIQLSNFKSVSKKQFGLPLLVDPHKRNVIGYSRQLSKGNEIRGPTKTFMVHDKLPFKKYELPSIISIKSFQVPDHKACHNPRFSVPGLDSNENKMRSVAPLVRPLDGFRSELCHLSRLRPKQQINDNTRNAKNDAMKEKKLKQIRAMKSIYLQRF